MNQVGMEGLLGELIPGTYADLLFLHENPVEDVSSLDRKNENLALIMKDRRLVESRVDGVMVEYVIPFISFGAMFVCLTNRHPSKCETIRYLSFYAFLLPT